ncbi:MAG: transcription-repair coupling factor [Desulfobulbaceae bacterium]|nr:transcription-repair coupling factor [Desulfobulbaceae bacterium]
MQSILKRLRTSRSPLDICGLRGSSAALFLARAAMQLECPVCCVVPTDEQMEILAQDIPLFTGIDVLVYPSFEIPPYTPLSPDPATVCQRLATLYRLQNNNGPAIILTSAEAALRRILPQNALTSSCELVMAGEETDREELIRTLVRTGYESCSMVQHEGSFSVRGGIVDIFAPAADPALQGPLRLDFFGDTVESIRTFDPVSQRSMAELDEAILLPASDILFPPEEDHDKWLQYIRTQGEKLGWPQDERDRLVEQFDQHVRFTGIEFYLPLVYEAFTPLQSLFDYLPEKTLTVAFEPSEIVRQADLLWERIMANHQEASAGKVGTLPPDRLFIAQDAPVKESSVNLCSLPDPESPHEKIFLNLGDHTLLGQEIEIHRKKRGNLAPLADRIIAWGRKKEKTILACRPGRQARHLKEMLAGYEIYTAEAAAPLEPDFFLSEDPAVALVEHHLSKGFDLPGEKIHILSAAELFGEKRLRPSRRKKSGAPDQEAVQIETISPGDIVVHRDHGLGSFQGLMNMEFAGQTGDFMLIEYRDGDKLYVPVDRLHWVSRYQGITDQVPKLDQLGSSKWLTTKNKVTEAVWKVAQELLDIYAKRALREGKKFSSTGELYHELEQSFPYDETSGQLKSIDAVLDDLTSDRPMDRLVCGDVGYGKTEVAARAAFKVIEDGYQVAVLVPTTVLAEQHAATFRDRFESFPVRVACINRFRTPAQQREIVRDLANGRIDLVIGTHRLLSKDITFSRLGLLIVDEEHRFGVTHKEKIKKIKSAVDVLTLTATPIPRTLQMSLLGIRDLSVISTPPRQRRSVKTFLAREDDLVIREGIVRELARGGQVFFVHNRVRTIGGIAGRIEKLVPQARIAVAHGQMPGRTLEDIMVRFINHEIDVLVCTTIIESGLDIANANTIIINRADQLGLADIYQLRGRVGRSSRQSYAYLLVPSLESLTRDAKQRLQALMDCNELGSGFKLAMNDLQIRGGGNLLGVSQSGHIAAVGYDLYLDLLQATVTDLKNKAEGREGNGREEIDPEIKLRVNGYIPEQYIEDPAQRYHLYRRISAAGSASAEELDGLYAEMADRFGKLPPQTEDLFRIISLKHRLRELGIIKLEQSADALIFSFSAQTSVDPQVILELISKKPKKNEKPFRLTPDNRFIAPYDQSRNLFAEIDMLLNVLARKE